MSTTRRTLLGAGAALALPVWMARAFASGASPEDLELEPALERARAMGKPLLVVFTDPVDERWPPGDLWGQLFALATQEVWLDLALVELVCLPRAALSDELVAGGSATSWGVLLETDGGTDERRLVEGLLPVLALYGHEPSHDARVRARAAELAALVRAAILPDVAARERREVQSRGSLDMTAPRDQGRFEAAIRSEPVVRLVDLDRFAALVRFRGEPEQQETLARAARQRLFEQDPSGARWKNRSSWCPPCGMGMVPTVSRYFLEFYTR